MCRPVKTTRHTEFAVSAIEKGVSSPKYPKSPEECTCSCTLWALRSPHAVRLAANKLEAAIRRP